MIPPIRSHIGSRLKALRRAKNLTQAAIAEALKCDLETISRYERGRTSPDVEQLMKIAKLLGVSLMDIFPCEADIAREELLSLRATLNELTFTIDDPALLTALIDQAKAGQKK